MDLELLKKEFEDAAASQQDSTFWAPKEGANVIRVLPPPEGSQLFYQKVGVHYRLLNSRMEFCPKVTLNQPCPICEFVDKLKQTSNPMAMEVVRRLSVVTRYLMNIYLLDEAKVVQYLAPKTVRMGLLGIILDPDWGDITRLDSGRNVVIEKIIPSGGNLKATYVVRAKPNISAVSISMSDIPKFDAILNLRMHSYDKIKAALTGGIENVDELVRKYFDELNRRPMEASAVSVSKADQDDVMGKLKSILGGISSESKSVVEEPVVKQQSVKSDTDDEFLAKIKMMLGEKK